MINNIENVNQEQKEEIVRLWKIEHMNYRKISDKFNIDRDIVSEILGIPVR